MLQFAAHMFWRPFQSVLRRSSCRRARLRFIFVYTQRDMFQRQCLSHRRSLSSSSPFKSCFVFVHRSKTITFSPGSLPFQRVRQSIFPLYSSESKYQMDPIRKFIRTGKSNDRFLVFFYCIFKTCVYGERKKEGMGGLRL